MANAKELRRAERDLRELGFVEVRKNHRRHRHRKFRHPDGMLMPLPLSPSDHRWYANFLRQLAHKFGLTTGELKQRLGH